jgi:hypothetical protein
MATFVSNAVLETIDPVKCYPGRAHKKQPITAIKSASFGKDLRCKHQNRKKKGLKNMPATHTITSASGDDAARQIQKMKSRI